MADRVDAYPLTWPLSQKRTPAGGPRPMITSSPSRLDGRQQPRAATPLT